MQAQPYLVVEGTVVGSRTVEIPAREPEPYTTSAGEQKTTRRRAASSYIEVGVNCPALLDGKVDPDVRAVLTVRFPDDVTLPGKGDAVRWAVEASQIKVFMRGQFREWLAYYYRGEAPDNAAEVAPTRRLAAASSS
jgi:hypothetical protein